MLTTKKLKRGLSLLSATILCFSSALVNAGAEIIYTDLHAVTVPVGGQLFLDVGINGGHGSLSTSPFAEADFVLEPVVLEAGVGAPTYGNRLRALAVSMPSSSTAIFRAHNDLAFRDSEVISFDTGGTIWSTGWIYLWVESDSYPDFSGNGFFPNNEIRFLGTQIGNPSFCFGWARLQFHTDLSLTVYDCAYENLQNVPIAAGQIAVPEPQTHWFILVGLLFLAIRSQSITLPQSKPTRRA